MSNDLTRQALIRDALLERIVASLSADVRVEGAWLSGSFGREDADEWSDFDLHVAIRDASLKDFLRDRSQLYSAVGEPILVQEEMASTSVQDGVFQLVYFSGGIEIDWNFGPSSQAVKPIAYKLLFERRPFAIIAPPLLSPEERRRQAQRWTTFFWAMAPIAIKYVGRGETRLAINQTGLLTRALICLYRLVSEDSGPDPWLPSTTNRPLEDDIDSRLPRPGRAISPGSALQLIIRLCEEMQGLHEQLSQMDIDVHLEMVPETQRLILICKQVIETAIFPRRRYR